MNETKNLFQQIAGNYQHFVGLLVLIVLAFAITFIVEKLAAKKESKDATILSPRTMAIVGIFGAISFVIMLFEFPLPFAPSFYKFDFSDVPALIVGFAAGPLAGVLVEFIKVLLNVLIQGTTTGFVGEIANFVIGACFVGTASSIYKFKKTRTNALISCLVATFVIAIVGALLNAYFMIPAFAAMFGGVENIIAAGTAIFPSIDSVFKLCLVCVAPFNLFKGVVDSAITFALYKQLSPVLKAEPMAVRKKVSA